MEQGSYVVKAVVGDLAAVGFKRLILKSDQANATRALQMQVKRHWGGDMLPPIVSEGSISA